MAQYSDLWEMLSLKGVPYRYLSLGKLSRRIGSLERLPFSLKVLLETVVRQGHEDSAGAFIEWLETGHSEKEVSFRPARVLMQDFTGVPAIVDLAAMREGVRDLGGDPEAVNPQIQVDLVIDHSVQVDEAGQPDALEHNMVLEFERNRERYQFLRWGQKAFRKFRVVPPGAGICHQVNIEYLAPVVCQEETKEGTILFPDSVYGTDSHTTMVNALGVLGWGVGGIEAEAAMLGQAGSLLIPDVIGMRLEGQLPEGATATDLVLTITKILRAKGVVGRFVEFYGPALEHLPLADRASIANMAPEYGATVGFFPVDVQTLDYLRQTGRSDEHIALVEAYCREQGLFRDSESPEPRFTDTVALDLATVEPSLAGPKRPQDRLSLRDVPESFRNLLEASVKEGERKKDVPSKKGDFSLSNGAVVIAAITSCTSTSNPELLITAGLVAKKAHELGLKTKPWVKTSLAPGSRVVTEYLTKAGLQSALDALGFQTVGYGCTTCIGNSGPLSPEITAMIEENNLLVSAVLSGNRNFEGRISPHVRANYLASPPLVVAYALLGRVDEEIATAVLGHRPDGTSVKLSDLWPKRHEVAEVMANALNPDEFRQSYGEVTEGSPEWQALGQAGQSALYRWDEASSYIQKPPYFEGISADIPSVEPVREARILALLGDNVTTDHISPAGSIAPDSPAGLYLKARGVPEKDFNSYGSRRGNDRVMVRGTFANIRLRNEMIPGKEGGYTRLYPGGKETTIFDAAEAYKDRHVPLIVIGGKEYGMGSSRDWAAKGTKLLGVKAVIAESFERIHRSNLVGMGVLPLTFPEGVTRKTLGLTGEEILGLEGLETLSPRAEVTLSITSPEGGVKRVPLLCRIDTSDELMAYRQGGILPLVARDLA
ncbi:aconitate hydratase AcnA [Acetobacteraceae bacterium ESL0709]|nr:aconitate hydratase AcnA [Acetobacteraceae bacterium ESL0697]MDF7677347.1 aconitate hydratase AcnA [Acetobacteraceae bacterium ESL0709]